jgi:hypothetical protein
MLHLVQYHLHLNKIIIIVVTMKKLARSLGNYAMQDTERHKLDDKWCAFPSWHATCPIEKAELHAVVHMFMASVIV